MNPSNVYWNPPQLTITSDMGYSGHLGFFLNLPYPDPISQPWAFGEGNSNIYGKRELVFSGLPEITAIENILPTTAGYARVDPSSFEARHSQSDYTLRVLKKDNVHVK